MNLIPQRILRADPVTGEETIVDVQIIEYHNPDGTIRRIVRDTPPDQEVGE